MFEDLDDDYDDYDDEDHDDEGDDYASGFAEDFKEPAGASVPGVFPNMTPVQSLAVAVLLMLNTCVLGFFFSMLAGRISF